MTIVFDNATIPDDIPPDRTPEVTDVEYPCQVCGREAGPYSGRGRKPKFCDDHKKTKPTGTSRKVGGQPAALATQATAVLVQVNGLMAIGLMSMQMYKTAHALSDANSTFEESAYQALLSDPKLCQLILKSGGVSGKMSLAMAYAGLGMAIAPAAMEEIQVKRQARADRKAQMHDDESGR